jgi:probable phosphoglycerate mutase
MSILLVRHGETAGNAARVLQGADAPLNERGMRQAVLLGERLCALGFAHVLCSDLPRARMTAAPLAQQSRATPLTIEETPLLQERNFGDLRGMRYEDLSANPFGPDFVPPNGESWDVFHDRVAAAFDLIVARRRALSGHLVVVTHGLVCRAILHRHAHLSAGRTAPDRFDNTSLSVLDAESPYAAQLINCTQHLHGDLVPGRETGAA